MHRRCYSKVISEFFVLVCALTAITSLEKLQFFISLSAEILLRLGSGVFSYMWHRLHCTEWSPLHQFLSFLCVCVCVMSLFETSTLPPSFSSVICVWNGSRAQLVPGRGRKNFRSASFGPFVFYFSIIYCCRTAVSSTNVLPLHHNSCYSAGDLLFPSNFHRLIIIPQ